MHDPFLPISCVRPSLSLPLYLSVVPHYRSFLLPRSIHVSLSRRLIPPHFSVAPRNLYVRFTIGVLRFCHCFIGESWLYNEALPLLPLFPPFLSFERSLVRSPAIGYDGFTRRSVRLRNTATLQPTGLVNYLERY